MNKQIDDARRMLSVCQYRAYGALTGYRFPCDCCQKAEEEQIHKTIMKLWKKGRAEQ